MLCFAETVLKILLSFGFPKDPNNLFFADPPFFMFHFHFLAELHFCHVHFYAGRSEWFTTEGKEFYYISRFLNAFYFVHLREITNNALEKPSKN